MTATMKFALLASLVLSAGVVRAQATQPLSEYRPTQYPETYQRTFYPSLEMRALPGARAAAVAAEAEMRRAQADLTNAVSNLRHSFSRSTELNEALAEERAAWIALKTARDHALAVLKDDETYQAAVALRDRMSRQLHDQRQNRTTTTERLWALATVKLTFAASSTAMEAAATAADPQVQAARERLVAAGKHLTSLNQQFDDAIRNSPQVIMARKQLDDAKIAAVATDAAYIEATRVARVALDFSYHIYDNPYPYVINTPYYGSGYGYGGSTTAIGYPIGWGR